MISNYYYKYLPINRVSYLDDEMMRITQPEDLNDPFECLPQQPSDEEMDKMIKNITDKLLTPEKSEAQIRKYKEIIQGYRDDLKNKVQGNLLDKIFSDSYKKINKEMGVLSLTKNWNNTLMWSHYSQSHQGFCIGFDPNHAFFDDYLSTDKTVSRLTREVTYSQKRVRIPMELNHKPLELEPFLTKSKDWEYEEEIRVIATLNLAQKVIKQELKNIFLIKLPHNTVKEIIVGANIVPKKYLSIKKFCTKNKVPFYQSKISNIKFDMERIRIV